MRRTLAHAVGPRLRRKRPQTAQTALQNADSQLREELAVRGTRRCVQIPAGEVVPEVASMR